VADAEPFEICPAVVEGRRGQHLEDILAIAARTPANRRP
jgi:hypothetical protein